MTADTALLRAAPTSTPGYVPAITGRRIAVMLSNGDWMVWGLQDTDGAAILGGDEAMIIANSCFTAWPAAPPRRGTTPAHSGTAGMHHRPTVRPKGAEPGYAATHRHKPTIAPTPWAEDGRAAPTWRRM